MPSLQDIVSSLYIVQKNYKDLASKIDKEVYDLYVDNSNVVYKRLFKSLSLTLKINNYSCIKITNPRVIEIAGCSYKVIDNILDKISESETPRDIILGHPLASLPSQFRWFEDPNNKNSYHSLYGKRYLNDNKAFNQYGNKTLFYVFCNAVNNFTFKTLEGTSSLLVNGGDLLSVDYQSIQEDSLQELISRLRLVLCMYKTQHHFKTSYVCIKSNNEGETYLSGHQSLYQTYVIPKGLLNNLRLKASTVKLVNSWLKELELDSYVPNSGFVFSFVEDTPYKNLDSLAQLTTRSLLAKHGYKI